MESPSESELAVLRLLSQNQLTVEALDPLLDLALSESGRDYRMASILATAVREGAIPMSLVERSMVDVGCRTDSEDRDGRCRRFRESVVAGVDYQAPLPPDLARVRARLLDFARKQAGGNHDLEAAYARALIDSKQLTVSDILTSYVSGDARSKGLVDEEVVGAFGRLMINGEARFDEEFASRRWRSALATAVAQLLRESRGNPEFVRQVRKIPEEVLAHARVLKSFDWRSVLGASTLCVIDKWRGGEVAPDKWTAWSQVLICRGW